YSTRVGSRTGAVFRRSSLSVAPRFLWECLKSVGPAGGRGRAGRNLHWVSHCRILKTERQATEVGRICSGVFFERRSIAWFQAPCAEQWLTVGAAQLIPFGRVSSIAHPGRDLPLRKGAKDEKARGR